MVEKTKEKKTEEEKIDTINNPEKQLNDSFRNIIVHKSELNHTPFELLLRIQARQYV